MFVKHYLKLFLVLISFTFILNVVQAEVPEEDTERVIYNAHNAVWNIEMPTGSGTAFFIAPNLFVTNFHVLFSENDYSLERIYLVQRNKRLKLGEGKAKVLSISESKDLVIVELVIKEGEGEGFVFLHVSPEEPSERLFALGYPDGIKHRVVNLDESEVIDRGYYYVMTVYEHYLGGISGSPVVNKKGEWVGVVNGGISDEEERDIALSFIKASKVEELRRGVIGIDCSELSLSACVEKAKIESLEEEVEQGGVLASHLLADKYYYGIGVEQNVKKAVQLMLKLADIGEPKAQYRVYSMYTKYASDREALMYLEERGVDEEKAVEYLLKSFEQGYFEAQDELTTIYLNLYERGFLEKFLTWMLQKLPFPPKKERIELMSREAELDFGPDLHDLALMYRDGIGVKKDIIRARKLMSHAVKKGVPMTQEILDRLKFSCREIF